MSREGRHHPVDDAEARRARQADVAISALVAAAAAIALILVTGERGPRWLLVTVCLVGGATLAVLDARRAGWRWVRAWQRFLFTVLATAILFVILLVAGL